MNIIEKEAENYVMRYYSSGKINNLENLKYSLTTKLYDFNRDRDKLDFLKILRSESLREKEDHLKVCQQKGCKYPEERDYGIFVIDQEIDSVNQYYTFETSSSDTFSVEEEVFYHNKLNEIIEKLNSQELINQTILTELESLKNHFNLGKKTWKQLLIGKVGDLALQKVINEVVINDAWGGVKNRVEEVVKMLSENL